MIFALLKIEHIIIFEIHCTTININENLSNMLKRLIYKTGMYFSGASYNRPSHQRTIIIKWTLVMASIEITMILVYV